MSSDKAWSAWSILANKYDRAAELAAQGYSVSQAAREIGVSPHSLYAFARRYGVVFARGVKGRPVSDAKRLRDEEMRELRRKGLHLREIAKVFNVSYQLVGVVCKGLGAARTKQSVVEARASSPSEGNKALPVLWWRFRHLKQAGIINNRETLRRWVDEQGFPPGALIGPNTRVWKRSDVEAWLATR